MRRSSLADFLRARPPRPNPAGAARDAWGVPTPRAVEAGFFLRREVDRRLVDFFRAAGPPAAAWEAFALAGVIPAGWVGDRGRVFVSRSDDMKSDVGYPEPQGAELAATLAADVAAAEEAETSVRELASLPGHFGPEGGALPVGWRARKHRRGRVVDPGISYDFFALLEGAEEGVSAADRAEAARRASLTTPAGPGYAWGRKFWAGGGVELIDHVYELAHARNAHAERSGGAGRPNPCVELLALWERGYEPYFISQLFAPTGRPMSCLLIESNAPAAGARRA